MYLGSAASMWLLPSLGRMVGADRLLQLDGALGMTWLVMWLLVGREIPHRWVMREIPHRWLMRLG
jgi:ACS family sodium-dependent inorganic phosphate cotransporter